MRALLLRLVINAIALFVAARFVQGISFNNDWLTLIVVAFIFGLVNALVRPILAALTCPLLVLTLGLFTFVLNAIMLALTSWVAQQLGLGFRVEGLWAAFVGAIVVGLVSFLLSLVIREAASA